LWFLVLAGASLLSFKHALKENSFYFLVITVLYFYVGLSAVVMRLLFHLGDLSAFYLAVIYFIGSGVGLIRFFIHFNKILKKQDAGLQ
jgi:hypothetical protein